MLSFFNESNNYLCINMRPPSCRRHNFYTHAATVHYFPRSLRIRFSILASLIPVDSPSWLFFVRDLYPVLCCLPPLYLFMLPLPRTRKRLAADLLVLIRAFVPIKQLCVLFVHDVMVTGIFAANGKA